MCIPKKYHLLLLIFPFQFLAAQNKHTIDSLEKVLTAQADDTNKVKTLVQLCREIGVSEPKGVQYGNQAVALAQKTGYRRGEANALNNLGIIFNAQGNRARALELYLASLKIREETRDEKGVAGSLNNIGSVHKSEGNVDLALDFFLKAKALNEKLGNKRWLCINLLNIGGLYADQKKDYDRGIAYHEEALRIATELNDTYSMALCLGNLGSINLYKKKPKEALKCAKRALKVEEEAGNKEGMAETYSLLGNIYSKLGKKKETKESYEKAAALAEKMDMKEVLRDAYTGLSEANERSNPALALKYYRKMVSLKDSIEKLASKERISEMQSKFDSEKKEKEFQVAEEKSSLELGRQKTITYFVIACLALLLVTGLILFSRSKLKQRTARELEEYSRSVVLLNEIGQKISSSLSVEVIVETVYESINSMMDAAGFGIGLVSKDGKELIFPLHIEAGERFRDIHYDLQDKNRLATWSLLNNKVIFINDMQAEVHRYVEELKAPLVGKQPVSLMYLPLKVKEKVIGVITVQSFGTNAYTQYHLNILQNLALYAATALDNARLYADMEEEVLDRTIEAVKQKEEVERAHSNTQLLSEIGQQLTSTLHFDTIFRKLHENVNKLMPADCFGVRIYHPGKGQVEYKFEIEKGEVYPESIFVSMDDNDNYSVWCIKNKTEIFINDNLLEHKKYVSQIKVPTGEMPHSVIFFPMKLGERVIGVITVQSFRKNAYVPYHLDILKTLASYTAIALENANLYNQTQQKMLETEKTYLDTKVLGKITKDITSSFSVENIIAKVYENVNALMDATCFGIGVLNAERSTIDFSGFIEKKEHMDDFHFSLEDKNRLAVWCFSNRRDIFINDFLTEYSRYISVTQAPVAGKQSASIMYVPLISKEKTIGVITVQSYAVNAYTDYHLDLLRNLATSVSIALDNAGLYQNLEQKVKERTAEVTQQKEIIEEKSKELNDSLNYARQIQRSILPNPNDIMRALPNCFGFYRPKHVVSGDFYWFANRGGKVMIAAADCTGHGVPGAFMSMIGIDKLNQAILNIDLKKPSEILSSLNMAVKEVLRQDQMDSSSRDGMDIALCAFDLKNRTLQFAGANRPMWLIRKGQLIEFKATKAAIGGVTTSLQEFVNHEVPLEPDDTIYIFTDGYADQFGGDKGKKMMTRNFKQLLLSIQDAHIIEHEKILEEKLNGWQGRFEQVDDILVIGIRV